jgi:hypothetical protein
MEEDCEDLPSSLIELIHNKHKFSILFQIQHLEKRDVL